MRTDIPDIPLPLIEALRKTFPPPPVTPEKSLAEIQYNAGFQAAIDWLAKKAESQQTEEPYVSPIEQGPAGPGGDPSAPEPGYPRSFRR